MKHNTLGQTLIVSPETPFSEITKTLEDLGWAQDKSSMVSKSLIAGEPELATWTWNGHKPFIVYSFNPVARMRILDVSTAPPAFRAMIDARLTLIGAQQLLTFLSNVTPRIRLLGLWGIQETERIDLIMEVKHLQDDSDPLVAEHAHKVAQHLEQIAQARIRGLASLQQLTDSSHELIQKLGDSKFVQTLCPSVEDCTKLFDQELADPIAKGIAQLYTQSMRVAPGERYTTIEATAATAGMLRWPNELSHQFPSGYRDIAGWMNPKRVWLTWVFKSTGGGTVRYDGLAWVEDHWVWLPKVFRVVAPLLVQLTGGVPSHGAS